MNLALFPLTVWLFTVAPGLGAAVAQACSIDLRRTAVLGHLGDSISLTQATHLDVSPLPRGEGWVVVDGEGEFVLHYSRSGQLVGRLLRYGHGPGEITDPWRAFVDRTDSLWVSAGRGRAIVLGEDLEGRTLTEEEFVAVDGDTPSGHIYAVRVSPEMTGDGGFGSPQLHADVLDRDGRFRLRAGPAMAFAPSDLSPMSFSTLQPYRLVAETDSTFLSPTPWGDEDTWLARWTTDGVERVLARDSAHEFLERELGLSPPPLERARHVRAGPDGAVWLLGSFRAVSQSDAEAIRSEVANSLELEANDFLMRQHPSVLNRTQTGVLLLVTADGSIIDGATLDHYPRGFVDGSHLFSLEENELGVLQIVIWRFQGCNEVSARPHARGFGDLARGAHVRSIRAT